MMQTVAYKYILIDFLGTAATFGSLFLTALLIAWIGFFLAGQLVTAKLLPRLNVAPLDDHPLQLAITLFSGLWASTTITLLLGLVGLFGLIPIGLAAVAVLALTRWYRLRWLPTQRPSLGLWATIGLFALIGAARPTAWPDGNFVVAGGHLARSGLFLFQFSDAQNGMAAITALINIFYEIMSPVTAVVGWLPFFAPLLILGASELIAEATGTSRWRSLGYLVLMFPLAFKAQEIRGSIASFGLVLWGLAFHLRYRKTQSRADLFGAALSFALAWRFAVVGALFGLLFVALDGLLAAITRDRKQALRAVTVLFWSAAISWPDVILTFAATLAGTPWRFLVWLPATLFVMIPVMAIRLLERTPEHKLPHLPQAGVAAVALLTAWAYLKNSVTSPKFNWFLFKDRASFPFLNFGSFGIYGWLFAACLIFAFVERLRDRKSPSASILGIGLSVGMLVQILCPWLLTSGLNPFGERAWIWDLWRDSALYWTTGFVLVAIAHLLQRLSELRPDLSRALTPRGLSAGVLAAVMLVAPSFGSYGRLMRGKGFDDFVLANILPHGDSPWRSQQIYNVPMVLANAFDLVRKESSGDAFQRESCIFCTVHKFGFISGLKPFVDFLLDLPTKPNDSFITGDSVMTLEHYVNRQIRYISGANTVSPFYILYLNDASQYEYYWKPWKRVRRTSSGVAYSVTQPERNLRWITMQPESGGATIVGTFDVPADGDYEVYRGDDFNIQKAQVYLNGQPVPSTADLPAIHLPGLKAGIRYQLRFAPFAGQPPKLDFTVPVVVYPHRFWNYERQLLEGGAPAMGQLPLMRFTGVPSAPITVDEMFVLMTTQDQAQRADIMAKYHVATIFLDPLLQSLFPGADRLLSADPNLVRVMVGGLPVFRTAL